MFERQILIEESHIVSEANMQDAAMISMSVTDRIDDRGEKLLCDASHGLCPALSFPAYTMPLLSNCIKTSCLMR